MSIHLGIYQRSRIYRRAHGTWVMFGLARLNGYGRIEAAVAVLTCKICGTPMYYYGKRRREEIREEMRREKAGANG